MSRGKHTEAQMIEALKQVEGGVRKKWAVRMACRSTRYMASISSETFSHWKDHDSYQKAFDRLIRDLKAIPEAPAHTRQ
jgi:hypothetical protein